MSLLTCLKDEAPTDWCNITSLMNKVFGPASTEIDPLMGCATKLYPIIRKAIELFRRRNGLELIPFLSSASELQRELDQWESAVSSKCGYSATEILNALNTAEALRLATLQCLHQCVRPRPFQISYGLAQEIMLCLRDVPADSNSAFVHTFPLLVAGCELFTVEDRE